MKKTVLNAVKRKEFSKGYLHSMRREGRIPGIFYLKNVDPVAIEVPENTINPLVFTAETHVIDLVIEGMETQECIIKEIQFDPVTDRVIHFDLIGFVKGEKIEIDVPVRFIGSPVGVKEGGLLQELLHKLQVQCFPSNIPEHIELNIENLKLGQSIHVEDIKIEGVEILNSPDAIVVSVAAPRAAKESEDALGEGVKEPEVISKGKDKSEE